MKDNITVRVLYFEGCPNAEPAVRVLESVLWKHGIDAPPDKIKLETPEQAESERFLGSPSIQINGQDIEQTRRNDKPFFGCRLYPGGGTGLNIPDPEMIERALLEALNG